MNRQSGSRREERHVLYNRVHAGDRLDTLLNPDTDDELLCRGYKPCSCGDLIHYLLCLLTCGIWLLVAYWRADWRLKLTHSPCRMSQATRVLLMDYYKQTSVVAVLVVSIGDGPDLEYTSKSSQCNNDNSSSDEDTACLAETTEETWFLRYFDFQNIRYIWDPDSCAFLKLCGLEAGVKCLQLHEDYTGFTRLVQQRKRILYGTNSIDIEVQSYPKLFVSEVLNPFYIFQVLSVALWMADNYYYYAACIIIISLISITVSLIETRRQSETLHDMVASKDSSISVCRGNSEFEQVATTDLVPGDVISIPANGCMMSCDAVLLAGNCIVNESMLTGESVPVTKTPLMHQEDNEVYSPELHKRHTLFSGTQVIQTRYYGQSKVIAVVVQTGFSTAKGSLVRAILFPKPIDFKFYSDASRFILFMASIASIGMAYTLYLMISLNVHPFKVFLRTMDIITIVVPPALPAAMTVGMVYAQSRLKKQGIFCISPPRINMSALIDVVCFDKTGTLTEDGLDLLGVVPLQGRRFLHNFQDTSELPRGPFLAAMATCHSLTRISGKLSGDPLDLKMFLSTNWVLEEPSDDTSRFDSLMPTVVRPPTNDSMYSCHLLDSQTLEETRQETRHFDSIMPTIVRPCSRDSYAATDKAPYEIGVVRQFTFSSSLQRMSVITRTLGETHMDLYTKGAPEKVASLCLPTTVPEDFHEVLHRYTLQGLRVIAVAWKPLDSKLAWHQAQKIHRDQIECDLRFLGFLIMQNTLKPVTTSIIHQLQMADIRTVMVTGDNMLTAVSVARECRMIQPKDRVIMVNAAPPDGDHPAQISWEYAESGHDSDSDTGNECDVVTYQTVMIEDPRSSYHFAINGKSYDVVKRYFPELMQKLCVRGTVFARMSPDQKSQLVEELQEMNYTVGMCGDGANDCGALKTAHAGISLSEAEASVASPFTSKTPNIQCVPTVVREGRAALVTSFGVFKYMALYSMIQFISVIILYNIEQELGDTQFLYLDLVVTTTVAFLMGHTAAYNTLVAQPPLGHLLSLPVLFSIVVQILVQLMCQVGVFVYVRDQPWFLPHVSSFNVVKTTVCFEGTLLFCYSAFQYLICAVCFSKGPPYRKHIWTNVPFTLSLIILTLLTTFLWMYPFKFLRDFLEMIYIHDDAILFKVTILLVVCGNLLISILIEEFISDSWLLRSFSKLIRPSKSSEKVYKQIAMELESDISWPPVGQITLSTGDSLISSLNDLSVN